MNTVRTTIAFDPGLHQQLALQAVSLGISLSDLVNKKLANGNVGISRDALQKQIADDLAFFQSFGKKMGKIDWVKALRKERDRDGR